MPSKKPPLDTIKPTMGRIVIYHPSVNPDDDCPAIVQRVSPDGSVWLYVFELYAQVTVSGKVEGTGMGQWSWPERG